MKIFIFIFLTAGAISCGQSSENNSETSTSSEVDSTTTVKINPDLKTTPFAAPSNNNEQVQLLIASAKETMDSIDLAYKDVRSSTKLIDLSLDEREKVNEALQELNNTKELIILETQKQVIDQLNQKSLLLKNVVQEINAKSDKLKDVCMTIRRVSDIIKKTTDLFATALTYGIVKPKLN